MSFCNNCHYPIAKETRYCGHCGQKNTDGRITVRGLLTDFFGIVFNLDNQLFRSLAALMIPGKLTNEYFKGRIKRYFHPIRMFFVLGVVFLLALGNFAKETEDLISSDLELATSRSYGYQLAVEDADSLFCKWTEVFHEPVAQKALDSLVTDLQNSPLHQEDSINIGDFIVFSGMEQTEMISRKDIYEMPIDTIYKVYNVSGFFERVMLRQKLKFLTSGSQYVSFMIGNAIWAMMIFMPFLALLLKLLYIRRKQYYVEHLIFSFHLHSMLFFSMSIVLFYGTPTPTWLSLPFLIGFIIYYFISIKRVYKQGWWKTIIKGSIISFLYMVFASIFAIIAVLIGFFFF